MSRWKQISSLVRKKTLVSSLQQTSYTFTPNKEEVIESRFRLRYSTTCNSYYRDWFDAIDPSSQEVITGWDKTVYSVDSVRRHIDEDIGQVYLERVPGSSTGYIKWRMDFGCCGLLVDEVTMRLSCVEDYGGEIIVTLMGGQGQKRVRYAVGSDYVTYTAMENSPELTLTVHFVGEAGQVTQLFPQNILRGMGYPLDIKVILKPPLESLGRPRILVGLLYSSLQEIEVDARHYKQNTSNQSGQGFLHIHLLRGRDLPQEKHNSLETFSKCYLLPDAKKTTKCRTKPRKGKDPYWNEQFLVVGINYHDIKRRALEICVADSNTSFGKRAKFVGGLRLSLGYKAVISEQTKQVNQVLRFLKAKGGASGGMTCETGEGRDGQRKVSFSDKDTVITKVSSRAMKWRQASWTRMPTESTIGKPSEEAGEEVTTGNAKENDNSADKGETVGKKPPNKLVDEPQSVSSTSSTEEMIASLDSVPDPTTKLDKDLDTSIETTLPLQASPESTEVSGASASTEEKNNRQTLVQQRLFHTLMTSIKQLEFAPRVGVKCNEEEEVESLPDHGKEDKQRGVISCNNDNDFQEKQEVSTATNGCQRDKRNDCAESGKIFSPRIPENVLEQEAGMKTQNNGVLTDKGNMSSAQYITKVENGDGNSNNLSEQSREEDEQPSIKQNGDKSWIKERASNQGKTTSDDKLQNIPANKTFEPIETLEEKQKFTSVSRDLKNQEKNEDGLESESIAVHDEPSKASTGLNEMKRSSSFTLRDLGKKLNLRRGSKTSEDEEEGSDTKLETGANKAMLDAEGLEITQWKLVVERPKQWHYCWQILRSEMTILH